MNESVAGSTPNEIRLSLQLTICDHAWLQDINTVVSALSNVLVIQSSENARSIATLRIYTIFRRSWEHLPRYIWLVITARCEQIIMHMHITRNVNRKDLQAHTRSDPWSGAIHGGFGNHPCQAFSCNQGSRDHSNNNLQRSLGSWFVVLQVKQRACSIRWRPRTHSEIALDDWYSGLGSCLGVGSCRWRERPQNVPG